ncbi:MAG: ImmA/IrrE family metallo-endopeptidase [Propionibacteriaceae bacterium]|jgi:HTH-type transcriptional regulator/antitoxin HigA|nr:ImmA/IrrE family metallo-endopeptidase [Propionibacteriaceae bacterium]
MARLPNYAVPTGEFIQEWMDDNGVNAAEMSRRLGVTPKHVSELLRGKVGLSADMAITLERVTGITSRFWNGIEAQYRSDLVRLEAEAVLVAQLPQAKAYPLNYLRKLGFIDAEPYDKAGVVEQVLSFFRVASMDALDSTWCQGVAYRKAAIANPKSKHLLTWLTVAERDVVFSALQPFDKDALQELLPKLRALSLGDPDAYIAQLIDNLSGVGVALRIVPEVPGLGVHGATRWLDHHPIIQLSLRGKADDQLWFTLFHELGHVLLHEDRGLYLTADDSETEQEADRFAADILIPSEMAVALPRGRNLGEVERLAAEIGVAPGIVLGRVQRDTGDYAWGNSLKQHFRFVEEPEDTKPNRAAV